MNSEIFSSWMGDLYERFSEFGRIPINRVLMLGSHDSGTSRMSRLARTQALTIAEQLQFGIRYLDIRPRVNRGTYYVHHTESGPDGSADLGHYAATLDPDDASNDIYIFKQIRDFLKRNPREILILKFQNYSGFGEHDYYDFVELMRRYFTFEVPGSKCSLMRREANSNGAQIAGQTVQSLLASNQRVLLIFDTENVPVGAQADRVWEWAFPFHPSLTQQAPFCLWDPYWHEASNSLADDTSDADFARWWAWHDDNLERWKGNPSSGFFVLQSQMTQLPLANALTSAERNNAKNLDHYLQRAAFTPLNVMTFDFVEQGDLPQRLVAYYERVLAG